MGYSDVSVVNSERFTCVDQFFFKKNLIYVGGRLGSVEKFFSGFDITFLESKIFCCTQSSMIMFTNSIRQSVVGVSRGYFVEISLVGLGYQFLRFGQTILLKVGFSHYIRLDLPRSIHIVGFRKKFVLYGVDIDEVNRLTKLIESFKKPDSYKGKGILTEYAQENLILKVGKQK